MTGFVEHGPDRAQARRGNVGGGGVLDDEADALAAPERHAHARADRRQRGAYRHEIIERVRQRDGHGDFDE
jgi:hypothetical protein